jgi:protein SCO1/2
VSRTTALLAVLALALVACEPASSTAFVASELGAQEDGWRGIPLDLEPPRTLPDVTLTDVDGDEAALADTFTGTPTLLFFGYTSCPDICPVHLATIDSAMDAAGVTTDEVEVVFVSVDPERDSRARIERFLDDLGVPFVGLRGEIEVVEAALDALNLPGPTVEGADPRGNGDLIGHPAQVIGFDAEGVARRVWPFGARRADWVVDLPRIVEEWSADETSVDEAAA